jgi:hypothetical protein
VVVANGQLVEALADDPFFLEPPKCGTKRDHAEGTLSELQAKLTISGLFRALLDCFRIVGWSQWVDATLSSVPHSLKTKTKSAG